MATKVIASNGIHLGFCPQKGNLYSVRKGASRYGKTVYLIYAVKEGDISELIKFEGN